MNFPRQKSSKIASGRSSLRGGGRRGGPGAGRPFPSGDRGGPAPKPRLSLATARNR